jgi:hypothetical protein
MNEDFNEDRKVVVEIADELRQRAVCSGYPQSSREDIGAGIQIVYLARNEDHDEAYGVEIAPVLVDGRPGGQWKISMIDWVGMSNEALDVVTDLNSVRETALDALRHAERASEAYLEAA